MNEGRCWWWAAPAMRARYADNWMQRTSRTPYPWRRQPEKRWRATLKGRCAVVVWSTGRWSPAKRKPYCWVIDASHPYAEMVSHNLLRACETAGVLLSRYQRPDQLSNLTHPLLYTARSIADACEIARRFGPRVLLTTGSKIWPSGVPGWRKNVAGARTARGGGDSTLQRTGVRRWRNFRSVWAVQR